jgi:hypothetical protein
VECATTVIRTGRTLAFTNFEFYHAPTAPPAQEGGADDTRSTEEPLSVLRVASYANAVPFATGSHDKAFI